MNYIRKKLFALGLICLPLLVAAGVAVGAANIDASNDFNLHYYLAHQYIIHADFDLAELELQQALVQKPQSRKAHRDFMVTSLMHLNFSQALAEFMITVGAGKAIPLTADEAKELDKQCAKLHYRKALKYAEQNRSEKEIFELQWASHYVPNSPTILRSLAFALANAGQNELAEKMYKESFELVENPSQEEAYAHADFAFMLGKLSRQDEAIRELRKAVQIEPKSPALHTDLAWFLDAKGDVPDATHEIEKAIDLAPNYQVGTVDVPAGTDSFLGLPMLTHHKQLAIYSNAGLWGKLGKLLEEQKKYPEAIKAYERALELDPQQEDVKASLKRLKK